MRHHLPLLRCMTILGISEGFPHSLSCCDYSPAGVAVSAIRRYISHTVIAGAHVRLNAVSPPIRKLDQLNVERTAGRAFPEFQEGPLCFPPTYKYIPGTRDYDNRCVNEKIFSIYKIPLILYMYKLVVTRSTQFIQIVLRFLQSTTDYGVYRISTLCCEPNKFMAAASALFCHRKM